MPKPGTEVFNRGAVADTTYFSLDENLRYFHYVEDVDVKIHSSIAEAKPGLL